MQQQSNPRSSAFAQSQPPLGASASVPVRQSSGLGISPSGSGAIRINSSQSEDVGRGVPLLAPTSSRDVASRASAIRNCQSFELPPSLQQVQPPPSVSRSECGAGPREQAREQRSSIWRFGGKSRQKPEADAQFDDTASVSSSTSSTASRRSVAQSLMSAAKSIKYAMVRVEYSAAEPICSSPIFRHNQSINVTSVAIQFTEESMPAIRPAAIHKIMLVCFRCHFFYLVVQAQPGAIQALLGFWFLHGLSTYRCWGLPFAATAAAPLHTECGVLYIQTLSQTRYRAI